MKEHPINNGLQPPEKGELAFDEFAEKAIDFVKKNIPIAHVYDLYDHDREVALNFCRFKSLYMNGEIIEDPDKEILDYDLWELFCAHSEK